jgi:hypothetical protein
MMMIAMTTISSISVNPLLFIASSLEVVACRLPMAGHHYTSVLLITFSSDADAGFSRIGH